MSRSPIDTDPEKLKLIVADLPVFSNSLKIGLAEIMANFQSLGNTWRDDEYTRFKGCLSPLMATVDEMTAELSKHQKDLEADVDNLIRIRNIKP